MMFNLSRPFEKVPSPGFTQRAVTTAVLPTNKMEINTFALNHPSSSSVVTVATNFFLHQQAAAQRRGERYAATADEIEDVVEDPGHSSSDEAAGESPRVRLSCDSNVLALKTQAKENRLSVESWGAAVEVEGDEDQNQDDGNDDDDDDDGQPGESPSDVEEEIDALEIQSDDSSAADDSDVECSFHLKGGEDTEQAEDDDSDDDNEYLSPSRDRGPAECPLQEIREILDATDDHPFLSIEDQIASVASHRSQCLYDFCNAMTNQGTLGQEELAVASKILLNEAHRHQVRRHKTGIPAVNLGGMHLLPSHLRSVPSTCKIDREQRRVMWERVANNAARDLYVEGHSFVQRRLSCMCIFSVTRDERFYHDNDSERMQRLARQERLLAEIQEQAMRGGNGFFLETPCSSV